MRDKEEDLLLSMSRLLFPAEILDYFEVVDYDETPEKVVFFFDERDELRCGTEGHTYEKNGFMPPAHITDFPIRDKQALLVIRCRRWKDTETGQSVCNSYDLTAKGTRHSKEFAAFLKETLGQIPDSGFFA